MTKPLYCAPPKLHLWSSIQASIWSASGLSDSHLVTFCVLLLYPLLCLCAAWLFKAALLLWSQLSLQVEHVYGQLPCVDHPEIPRVRFITRWRRERCFPLRIEAFPAEQPCRYGSIKKPQREDHPIRMAGSLSWRRDGTAAAVRLWWREKPSSMASLQCSSSKPA